MRLRSIIRLGGAACAALGASLLSACTHAERPPPPAVAPPGVSPHVATPHVVSLVVRDVTVIDPETRRVLPHRSVFIDGRTIVAVTAAGRSDSSRARRVVEGAGRFLIPGLADMHVHLFLPEPPTAALNLLIANGVTGIREMSSDCWEVAGQKAGCVGDYKALRSRIEAGEVIGPDLLSLTSTMVMGPSRLQVPDGVDPFIAPRTPQEARRLALYLAGRGVDRIKTHDSISRDAFFALMEEARSRGVEVAGHVPFGAGSLGAARAGYGSIEHARDLLYECSRYGPELRGTMEAVAELKAGAVRPSNLVRMNRTVDEFDRKACTAFLARLARTGTYYVPTHVTREMEARAADPTYRADPRRKYIARARDSLWAKDLDETAALPPEEAAALGRFFRHGLAITGMAHRAGVPIMAGTDSSDTMMVPGFSLHSELALLARAGLTPMDVLRSATTIPARYLGRTRLMGGISAGKEADLVLLRADPIEDISNTGSIEAVISNGRLFDRPSLDALLAEAESLSAAQ